MCYIFKKVFISQFYIPGKALASAKNGLKNVFARSQPIEYY